MIARLLQQICVVVLAVGIVLSGAAPALACAGRAAAGPQHMAMSMTAGNMQQPCGAMHKTAQHSQSPCKHGKSACPMCAACLASVTLNQGWFAIGPLLRSAEQPFPFDVVGRSIAVRPALPPPIVLV